jgi:hypothetical protein
VASQIMMPVQPLAPGEDTGRNGLDEEALTLGVGLALLKGLVKDLAVVDTTDGLGTQVRMSWPVSRRAKRDGAV